MDYEFLFILVLNILMFDSEDIAHLTSLIMAAALDHNKWDQVLYELHSVSGGIGHFLVGRDSETSFAPTVLHAGFDESYIRSFKAHYSKINPSADNFHNARPNLVLRANEICERSIMEGSEFYNDWIKPQDDIVGGGGIILSNNRGRSFGLGGMIRRAEIDRLEDRWVALINLISPHLNQAFEINRQFAGKAIESYVASSGQTGIRNSVFLVNSDGYVIYCCRSAQELLDKGDLVGIGYRGQLSFKDLRADNILLNALIALKNARVVAPSSVLLSSEKTREPYIGRIGSLFPERFETSPLGFLFAPDEPILLVVISSKSHQKQLAPVLAQLFGLTPSEVQVALLLADGDSIKDIATLRGVSVNTVRNQVKSVMSKMAVCRQVELVLTIERIKNDQQGFY
ncbi:MAG TPA: hypothetical protein DCS30_02380 [Rhizobiales bacterium]|nr:hypothetical protein [Hyphomicrobiales bacterium]